MGAKNAFNLDIHTPQPWVPAINWTDHFTGTLFAAATLMVVQKLLLRSFTYGSVLGLDDALILLAWLASTAFFSLGTITLNSLDRGVPVQPSKFEFLAHMVWSIEAVFVVSQGSIKLAVLAILNRFVKATADTRIRYAIYLAATFTTGYSLVLIIISLCPCRPIEGFWRALDPIYAADPDFDLRCMNTPIALLVAGVVAVITDIYTIAIPWAISRSFGLNKRQTLALNLVFMLGLIVTVASGIRTYYIVEMYMGHRVSHNLVHVFIWGTVEVQVAIICACLPSLRVIYRLIVGSRLHQRYFSRTGETYDSTRTGETCDSARTGETYDSVWTAETYDSAWTEQTYGSSRTGDTYDLSRSGDYRTTSGHIINPGEAESGLLHEPAWLENS